MSGGNHNKMATVVVACLLWAIQAEAQLQQHPMYSVEDSLHSSLLGETRKLLIALPENYNTKQRYPVVYLLDGDWLFSFYPGMVRYLSYAYVVPDMIVVGVMNTDRTRDYTPTVDTASTVKPNGGGEVFTGFLEKELIPYIESHYATAPYRILEGHSLSGLLAVNALLKHTSLFNAYVALDPSLWWNNRLLNKESEMILSDTGFKGKRLFLAMANSMPAGMTDTAWAKKDNSMATNGMRATWEWRDQLIRLQPSQLNWQFAYYPRESHGSVPVISSYESLQFIFDFYKRPSFQTITDSTAIILENHYHMVSEKMGYTVLPPESDISGLAWRCKVLEKNDVRALVFLQMHARLYPASVAAYKELAAYYEERGNAKEAAIYQQKAAQLSAK